MSMATFLAHHCFDGLPDPFRRRLDLAVSDVSVTHGHAYVAVSE